jgi:biopolymer transport protein TolQ
MRDVIIVNLITAVVDEAAKPKGILDMLVDASGVVLGTLVLLVLFSAASWFIIGYKGFYLWRARSESVDFLDTFWQSKRLDEIYKSTGRHKRSPVSQVFKAGYVELTKLKSQQDEGGKTMSGALGGLENVERSLRRASTSEVTHLESLVPVLATIGSTAPFVGLFGTVWGIMNAFVNINQISEGSEVSLAVVAGPIAEALVATAIGLFAAIPAVIAYNYFVNRIRVLSAEMDNFSADFLNIVKRHFLK